MFFSRSSQHDAQVEMQSYPYTGRRADIDATLLYSARRYYFTQDPEARIQLSHTRLPAGTAYHVSVRLVRYSQSTRYPLAVESYAFYRDRKLYEFTYTCDRPRADRYLPVFSASARSVRFH